MKKLILLLALALGVEVKGQIVGGFMPQNSTKSFTAGNATFSNVIARGTLSVGSTATFVGEITTSSVSGSASGFVRAGYLQANGTNGFVVGSVSGVNRIDNNSGTFRFLGTANTVTNIAVNTMSLGSANLTGGNTGTVAVLSDALFPINLNHASSNPADATEYYLGNNAFLYAGAVSGSITLPYNCTLVGWNISVVNTGGNGSAGSATVSISGTTNYTLSTAINYTTITQAFSATGLSQNFNANDVFNVKILTPTWVTNPTAVFHGVTLWFVRRS